MQDRQQRQREAVFGRSYDGQAARHLDLKHQGLTLGKISQTLGISYPAVRARLTGAYLHGGTPEPEKRK